MTTEVPLFVSDYSDPDLPNARLQFDRLEIVELRNLMVALRSLEAVAASVREGAERNERFLDDVVKQMPSEE